MIHLVQQRGDGIVRAVQDEEQRRNLRAPKVKELVFLSDHLLVRKRGEKKKPSEHRFTWKKFPLALGTGEQKVVLLPQAAELLIKHNLLPKGARKPTANCKK